MDNTDKIITELNLPIEYPNHFIMTAIDSISQLNGINFYSLFITHIVNSKNIGIKLIGYNINTGDFYISNDMGVGYMDLITIGY